MSKILFMTLIVLLLSGCNKIVEDTDVSNENVVQSLTEEVQVVSSEEDEMFNHYLDILEELDSIEKDIEVLVSGYEETESSLQKLESDNYSLQDMITRAKEQNESIQIEIEEMQQYYDNNVLLLYSISDDYKPISTEISNTVTTDIYTRVFVDGEAYYDSEYLQSVTTDIYYESRFKNNLFKILNNIQ